MAKTETETKVPANVPIGPKVVTLSRSARRQSEPAVRPKTEEKPAVVILFRDYAAI